MLATNTSIEFARFSDAIEISDLSKHLIEFGFRSAYTPYRICHLINNPSSNVVVARKQRTQIGFGIMTYREDSANLDLLATKISYRRQGVGTQVVQWLEKVASTSGAINIFVQVRKTNVAAVRFYQTLNFNVIDEVPGYYQGRETAVIMCKGIRQVLDSIQISHSQDRSR